MKKNMKNLLAVLFTVAILAVFSIQGFCADEGVYTDVNNNQIRYTQNGDAVTITGSRYESVRDLVIPETINGIKVTAIAPNAFSDATLRGSLTLPGTLKQIGASAFYGVGGFLKAVNFGDMEDCVIGNSAFASHSYLEAVNFRNMKNCTIGANAFAFCPKLTTVTFGTTKNVAMKDSVFAYTGIVNITIPRGVALGRSVFLDCRSLETVTILGEPLHQVVTQKDSKGNKTDVDVYCEKLFEGCLNLKSVTLSESFTQAYEDMFAECTKLESLSAAGFTKLTRFAFQDFTSLKTVYMPNLTEVAVCAFDNCSSLTEFDFSKVIKIEAHAFEGCSSLKAVDLHSVMSIDDYAFGGCTSLKELVIYHDMKLGFNIFYECTGIERLIIGDDVTTFNTIDKYTSSIDFVEGCDGIKYIYIGKNFKPLRYIPECKEIYKREEQYALNVEALNDFIYMTKLETIEVSPENPWYFTDEGVLYLDFDEAVILLRYPQAKEGDYYSTSNALKGVTKPFALGYCAFSHTKVKEVEITMPLTYLDGRPASKPKIYYGDCSNTFWGSAVEKVTFPKGGLTFIGYAMFSESQIREIDLSQVTSVGNYAFEGCNNLEYVDLPKCVTVGEYAFSECQKLKSVNLPLWTARTDDWDSDRWSVYRRDNWYDAKIFYKCTALESVNMPLAKRIPGRCFYGCTSLVNVNAPDCIKLERYCFYGCTSLERLDMTVIYVDSYALAECKSFKYISLNEANIYECAFKGCISLESIDGIDTIGKNAFESCTSLKNIKFQGVSSIRDSAFKGCSSLALLQFDSMNCSFGKNVFEGCPNVSFYCDENSTAYTYAVNNNIPVVAVSVSFQNSKYEYTGKEIEPSIIVSIGEMALVQNKDYTLRFEDNVKVGGATVIVHFIGDFEGLPDAYRGFSIVRRNICLANIEYVKDNVYDGEDIRPAVVVTLDGKTLTENVDYVIEYKNGSDIGTMLFTVKGIGNYTGTVDCYYNIIRRDIAETSVEKLPDCIYTGDEICPVPVIKWNGFILVPDEDFEVRYFENVNAGFGTAVIYGKGNFCGTQKVTFRIFGKDIQNSVITEIPDQTYNGSEIRPDFTVTLNGITLTEGTDYTAEYINNTEKGVAEIIISGTGNYSGVIRKTFNIRKNSVYGFTVFSETQMTETYDGTPLRPEMEVYFGTERLTEGKDYEIRLEDNISAGTATVTVIGIGLFEGERTYNFTILPCEISEKDISVSGSLEYNGAPVEPQITVTKDGKTLQYGTDYIVRYSDNNGVGTAFVTVEGVGNYCNSTTLEYEIFKNEEKNPEPDTPDKPEVPDNPEQNDPSKDNTDKTNNGKNDNADNGDKKPEKPSEDSNTPSKDNGSKTPQIPNTDAEKDCTALFTIFALLFAADFIIRKREKETQTFLNTRRNIK